MRDRLSAPRPLPVPCLALLTLRQSRNWRQGRLARAARVSKNVVHNYERGVTVPTRAQLVPLASVLGYDESDLDWLLFSLQALADNAADRSPVAPTAAERRIVRGTATAAARAVFGVARLGLERLVRQARARRQLRDAEAAWARLAALPPEARRAQALRERGVQAWALCRVICDRTLKETPRDPRKAIELAELGCQVAATVPGDPAWRAWVEGHAWAHLGNARRVANDHDGGDAAFAGSKERFAAGATAADPDLFDPGRPLDMEASLRRAERRFEEALTLHERAFAVSWPEHRVHVLLNKAGTLEQARSYDAALATLSEADRYLQGQPNKRLLFTARFNRAVNLCHLDRYADAAGEIPALRETAVSLRNQIDVVKTLWLEGRVVAGLGQREEAIAIFEQVRADFVALGLPYNMALACLDLAALYLEAGRNSEVKSLAEQMVLFFRARNVHRESLAAAQLFHRATVAETATAELARRIGLYLESAPHNPALPFEG